LYSQRTKIKITRRRGLRQNRCVFSTRRNCPRDRSRWRRLSGWLFHSSIVLMVYGFSQNLLFSHCTDAGQHLSIILQVHGLCLGLTGRLREKPVKKWGVKRHMWIPVPEKVAVSWPPGPRGSAAPVLKRLLYETILNPVNTWKKIKWKFLWLARLGSVILRLLRLEENTARLDSNILRLSFCGFGCGSQV